MVKDDPTRIVPQGYTLLTGATGLLGRYLMRDLLAAGHSLAVLVRSAGHEAPESRIDAILASWEQNGRPPLPRPHVLEGDVAAEGLGLDAASRAWIGAHCERVVHGAAVVKFHSRSRRDEPWRTNEHGASQLYALAEETGIQDVHHISTAYVSGDRRGVVLESDLARGQGFRNDYEESKYLAEVALEETTGFARKTVYRPGVIAGDSRTGYTSTFHGLYVYLRALSILIPRIRPDANGVRNIPYDAELPLDEGRNIVPVDWVSEVIARLLETPEAHGRTYHLTPAQPTTTRDLLNHGSSWYGDEPVALIEPGPWERGMLRLSRALRMLRSYESYGGTEPTFDTTNLARFASDLPCPALDEGMVHRFLAYAEQERWGRG